MSELEFYRETRFKDTEIGRVPEDWEVVKLGPICDKIKAGGTPLRSKTEFWDGDIPFVKIEDITSAGKYLTRTKERISKLGLENSSAWIVPKGSLLLAMYGSLGEIAISRIPTATNQAILGIVPGDGCDVEFLYYWFLYFKPRWKKHAKTTTQANLTAKIVRNTKIPLPPLPEQQKIAEILRSIDEAIGAVEDSITKLERLRKGAMEHLLTRGINHTRFKEVELNGRRVKIPAEWEVVRLEEIIKYTKGKKPKVVTKNPRDGWLPYLSTEYLRGNISTQFVKPTNNEIIAEKGDILLLWDGSNAGEFFLAKMGVLSSTMVKISLKKEVYDKLFLFYLLKSREHLLKNQTRGTGIPHVDKNILNSLMLPLPRLQEQQKIAEILHSIDEAIEAKRMKKAGLERMKKAVMEKLLTGEVRVR